MEYPLYLIVKNNVAIDMVDWDGNSETWTPPEDAILLPLATTLAKTWVLNADKTEYIYETIMGMGSIGDTWDGEILTTTQIEPPPIDTSDITTTGTQLA